MSYRDLAQAIGREPFAFVELDLDFCQNTFGVAPCTATLIGPGKQCFNLFMGCQDKANYNPAPRTYRFIEPRFASLDLPGAPAVIFYTYVIHADTAGGDKYSQSNEVPNNLDVVGNRNSLSWTFPTAATAFHVYRQKSDTGAADNDMQLIATLDGSTFDYVDANAADLGGVGGSFPNEVDFVLSVTADHGVLTPYFYVIQATTGMGPEWSNAIEVDNDLTRPGASNSLHWVWPYPATAFKVYRDSGSGYRLIASLPATQHNYRDIGALEGATTTPGTLNAEFVLTGNAALVEQNQFFYPCIRDIKLSPTKLEPGKALGRRASITVELQDFKLHDIGIDPYVNLRTVYVEDGFLSRLFARQRISMLNRPLRVVQGFIEDPSQRETRYYLIEKVDGPDDNGVIRITAKDTLKFTDNDRSQAPKPTTGVLSADLAATGLATTFTLTPAGVGDDQYDDAGWVRIDDEIIEYTRAADVFTIVNRRALGTAANGDTHSAGSTAQLVLRYVNQYLHEIVYDLMVKYAGVSPAQINFAAWEDEVLTYMPRQYTGTVSSATGVRDLLDELASQAPFFSWWDERKQTVRLTTVRLPDSSTPVLNYRDHLIAGSVKVEEKSDLRVSQVWVYYKQRDPTKSLSTTANWSILRVYDDAEGESPVSYGSPAVKIVYARFIDDDAAAVDTQQQIIGRYRIAPRQVSLDLDPKDGALWTGDLAYIVHPLLLDANGRMAPVLVQIIQANEDKPGESLGYQALEYFAPTLSGDDFDELHITDDQSNFNAYDFYVAARGVPTDPVKVRFILDAGVQLGGIAATQPIYPETIYNPDPTTPGTPGTPAFSTGTGWPSGTTLQLVNLGLILGFGGYGGSGNHLRDIPAPGGAGYPNDYSFIWGRPNAHDGGTAIFAEYPIAIDNLTGQIWGGGGGGEGGPCVWSNASQDSGPSGCIPASGAGGGGCGSAGGGGAGASSIGGGPPGYVGYGDTGDLTIETSAEDGDPGTHTDGGAGGGAGAGYYAGAAGGAPGEPGQEVPLPALTADCEMVHRGYGPGAAGFAAYGPVTFANLGDTRGPFHS